VALAAIVAMRMSISNLLEMPRIEDRSKTHRVVSANRIDIVASALETVQLLLAGHSVATDLPARPLSIETGRRQIFLSVRGRGPGAPFAGIPRILKNSIEAGQLVWRGGPAWTPPFFKR
jgi:hypothetical protein